MVSLMNGWWKGTMSVGVEMRGRGYKGRILLVWWRMNVG